MSLQITSRDCGAEERSLTIKNPARFFKQQLAIQQQFVKLTYYCLFIDETAIGDDQKLHWMGVHHGTFIYMGNCKLQCNGNFFVM